MILMSSVSAEAPHAAKAVLSAEPVQFMGTFSLKVRKIQSDGTWLTGYGNLAKFGRTRVIVVTGDPGLALGSYVGLENKHSIANWDVQLSLPAKGTTLSVPYSIDQDEANGIFAHENNTTGTLTISDVVSKGGKDSYVLKLS